MKLTYHPEGASEPTVWEFTLGKLRVKETKAIEAATKMAYGSEFKVALLKGNTTARQAMLWHFLKKQHPGQFKHLDDVDFADDELTLEQGAAEWQESYDQLLKMPTVPNLDDAEREAVLDMMRAEIAEARKAEGLDEGPEREPVGKEDSASEQPTS